jgi:hypothetical protein
MTFPNILITDASGIEINNLILDINLSDLLNFPSRIKIGKFYSIENIKNNLMEIQTISRSENEIIWSIKNLNYLVMDYGIGLRTPYQKLLLLINACGIIKHVLSDSWTIALQFINQPLMKFVYQEDIERIVKILSRCVKYGSLSFNEIIHLTLSSKRQFRLLRIEKKIRKIISSDVIYDIIVNIVEVDNKNQF